MANVGDSLGSLDRRLERDKFANDLPRLEVDWRRGSSLFFLAEVMKFPKFVFIRSSTWDGTGDARGEVTEAKKDSDKASSISSADLSAGAYERDGGGGPGILASVEKSYVERSYTNVGIHLKDELVAAVLVDLQLYGSPIIGVSKGFIELTQYTIDDVLGSSFSCLERGLQPDKISQSGHKEYQSFCKAIAEADAEVSSESSDELIAKQTKSSGSTKASLRAKNVSVGDITVTQHSVRKDDSCFMFASVFRLVMLKGHPYALGVLGAVPDSTVTGARSGVDIAKRSEECRLDAKKVTLMLRTACGDVLPEIEDNEEGVGPLRFFDEQLQDHCVLLSDLTAVRREADDIPNGCLVFSRDALPWISCCCCGDGLRFSVVVDKVTTRFHGLPLMGFTQRRPVDDNDCYPMHAQCMGSSVSIGRTGNAYARDQSTHTKLGFRKLPPEELETWTAPANFAKDELGVVSPGDVLECSWNTAETISMRRNGQVILSFQVGRRPQEDLFYYAFLDLCFSVSQLTLLDHGGGEGCSHCRNKP